MKFLWSFLLMIFAVASWSQVEEPDSLGIFTAEDTSKYQHFFNHADPTLALDEHEEEQIEFKKKKPKRKVFYKRKTKKGFTKKGQGPNMEIEVFFYLKTWEEPSEYVRDIYWFDPVKIKINKSRKYDPETHKLLHGPYKKMIGNRVVEKGIYYMGTKHGRWEYYDKEKKYTFLQGVDTLETEIKYQLLKKKERWSKGWPRDAEISYFDANRTKIKEVVPYDHTGKLEGKYYRFFPDAHVEEMGMYAHGEKVGKWYTYHDGKKRHFRKEVWVYPDWRKKKEQDFEPYLELQYDKTGHVLYDKKKGIDEREEPNKK